jgi:hypothetical protein
MTSCYHRCFVGAYLACVLSSLWGCQPQLATVQGHITYCDRPLAGGSIIFYCANGQIVRGLIGPEGYYQVTNVPYGLARVAIHAFQAQPRGLRLPQKLPPTSNGPIAPGAGAPSNPHVSDLPARYAHPEESGLYLVVDQPQTLYDVDLRP